MTTLKTILISNDDGYDSAGIVALAQALAPIARVVVVAPQVNQSASSHSITLRKPLRLARQPGIKAENQIVEVYSVDGTPSDAVSMGVNYVLKDQKVDLVVSGINHGANLGKDVVYSGTVAAAREAVFLGIPAVALSLVANHSFDFKRAADFAQAFCEQLLVKLPPANLLFNVNVPKIVTQKDLALTVVGRHDYSREVEKRLDPRGEEYFWVGGQWSGYQDLPGTDCKAVAEGFISVTPLNFALTNEALFPWLSDLEIANYQTSEQYKKAASKLSNL